jgi:hypothetical protein
MPIVTSETLHNENCFNYLKALYLPASVLDNLKQVSPDLSDDLKRVHDSGEGYKADVAYADLYTKFFSVVEDNIERIFDEATASLRAESASVQARTDNPRTRSREQSTSDEHALSKIKDLNQFIDSIYSNKNDILKSTFEAIKHIPLRQTPSSSSIESQIKKNLRDDGNRVNTASQSPAQAGSAYGRAVATFFSDTFKPQHTTSLATVREYDYNRDSALKELRFGTQGQRHKGVERVSPLFERWLQVQALNNEQRPADITHVYINNLGLDRTDMEGKKERALTLALHQLEEGHPNLAVITLPADKGLMSQSDFKKTTDAHSFADVENEFLQISKKDSDATRAVKDFFISDAIRERIFSDNNVYSPESEKAQLKTLFDKSAEALKLDHKETLTSAERQALWFHFTKFELTNHIIDKLAPKSVNFSCKDAIDRGGVSSAYYNLMSSIQAGNPLKREEFECALHAAPAMVKARGMNHHLKLIWNAVDTYITANYADINKPKSGMKWLIEWRDLNCPHARVEALLKQRVRETIKELGNTSIDNTHINSLRFKSLRALKAIQEQSDLGTSGKRLLLEVVTRTPEMVFNPGNKENAERYEKLADVIEIKYPKLQALASMIKVVAGAALYVLTLGKAKETLTSGIASFKAAIHSDTRESTQQNMKEQIQQIRTHAPNPANAVDSGNQAGSEQDPDASQDPSAGSSQRP